MSGPPGKRFERLEIGVLGPAPAAAAPAGESRPCHHCGQLNPAAASACWACLKSVDAPRPAPAPAPQVLADAREPRIVVRIDGKVYTSADKELPEQPREVIDAVRSRGLTPEVLEGLRRRGESVRYRPASTAYPSDGDLDFWDRSWRRSPYGYRWPAQMWVPWYWMLLIFGGACALAFLLFQRELGNALAELFGP